MLRIFPFTGEEIWVQAMYYGTPYMIYGTHFIKSYREAGYITARSNNLCSVEVFPIYDWNCNNLTGYDFDHEHFGLFCDPNFIEPLAPFSSLIGCYSFRRKCSYGTDSFNHIFRYGLEFLKAYKEYRDSTELRFADYYRKYKKIWKSVSDN